MFRLHRQYLVLIVIIALGLMIFMSLKVFINAFLGALIFYVLFRPLMVHLIHIRKWKPSLAAAALMFISFFIILLPIVLTSTLLYSKVKELIVHSDDLMLTLSSVIHRIEDSVGVKILTPELIKKVSGFLQTFIPGLLNESASALGTLGMMYFFLYFLLTNVRTIEKEMMDIMPFKRSTTIQFGTELVSMTYSSAIGIPVIALVQGFCALLAYLIVGMPEPFFWACVTALVSVIPVVGTALVWVPAGIYMIASGMIWQAVFVFAFGVLVLSNVDNLVRFFIQKKFSDVHPVVTLLGVIFGLDYFGMAGILFGPLLIAWFMLLVKKYQEEFLKANPQPVIENTGL